MEKKVKFCKADCLHLDPIEENQTEKDDSHLCLKHMKIVKHEGHHPNLVRVPECKSCS